MQIVAYYCKILIIIPSLNIVLSKGKGLFRVGKLILTALAIGRETLRNAAKNLQFVLAQEVLTLTRVSANFHPSLLLEGMLHFKMDWASQ